MNELMIVFEGGNYIYYKTNKTTAWGAYKEFECTCESAQINIDNMNVVKAELMNEDFETLSVWVWEV